MIPLLDAYGDVKYFSATDGVFDTTATPTGSFSILDAYGHVKEVAVSGDGTEASPYILGAA